jgi:HlyD family secretion protein
MPIRRLLVIFTLLTVAVPFGFFYLEANPPQSEEGSGGVTTNIQYYAVNPGTVEAVVSAVGTVEAQDIVDVSFTTGGRVTEVYVREGDYVQEGALLMRVQNDLQRIAYDQAVLNLELAEIDLADLSGPPDADNVAIAEANVDAAYGNYQASLTTAPQGDIDAADLRVEQAQAAYDAAVERRIYGGDFTSEEAVTLADAQIGAASFDLEIARLTAQDLRSGNSAQAQSAYQGYLQRVAELERVLAGPDPLEIEQAEVRVTQAMAAMESAELALSKTELRAPFTGVISDVYVEPGAIVSPGAQTIRMVDVEPLSLTIQIDEIDIGLIEPGMPVSVEVDALPNQFFDGRLTKIALTGVQSAGGIVNYDAEVELVGTDPRIRIGMTAEANIIVEQSEGVLYAPNAFIRLDRRQNKAFVQLVGENNEFEEREVALGLRGANTSEITSGLNEGDIIAADLSGNQFQLFGG